MKRNIPADMSYYKVITLAVLDCMCLCVFTLGAYSLLMLLLLLWRV